MATYNEIVNILKDYSEANFVIKSFGNGEIWELVETFGNDDAEYPKLWAEDMPNTTATGEEVFKFRIYMLGQVATLKEKTETTLGEDNVNEVKSNMRQNCLDLLSYLIQQTNYSEITSDRNVVLTSFRDKSNDKLTGWYFDLNIRQAFRFSSCIIPMSGIAPPPSGVCDDGTVNIKDSAGNTLYVKTVASGGVENQTITDSTVDSSASGYSVSVLAEGALVLPDTTYEVYVDGVLESTATLESLVNQTININWT